MAVAGLHLAAISSPAFAQVQPVPYGTSQPVPYNPTPAQPTPPPATTAAPAQGGNDVIHLKNGGLLRGTIVDVIPGSHARIQLPTGEIAMVQWSEIARIEQGGAKPPPPPPPTSTAWTPPPPPPPNVAPPLTGPKLLVHLDSSRPVRLARYETTRGVWDDMCDSPCDKQVPVEGDYRIEGIGVRPSNRFSMQGKAGERVVIDVSAASKGWFAVGLVSGGLGLTAIGLGLYVVAIGAASNSFDNSICGGSSGCSSTTSSKNDGVIAAGWTIAGVGLALGALGVIIIASNWSTGTSQEVQERASGPAPGPAAQSDAYRRDALWRDVDVYSRALPKPVAFIPLVTQSF
jgi:hypothetical protein